MEISKQDAEDLNYLADWADQRADGLKKRADEEKKWADVSNNPSLSHPHAISDYSWIDYPNPFPSRH